MFPGKISIAHTRCDVIRTLGVKSNLTLVLLTSIFLVHCAKLGSYHEELGAFSINSNCSHYWAYWPIENMFGEQN